MKKIAILADFPRFAVTGDEGDRPVGVYATWLPQLAQALEAQHQYEIHWLIIDGGITKATTLEAWGQKFHYLPRWKKSIAIMTGYWADRRKISRVLRQIKPDLIHAWGSEGGYGLVLLDHPGTSRILSMQGILSYLCTLTKQRMLMRLQAAQETRVLRRVKEITCESEWGIEKAESFAPHAKFHHIEYGVNPQYLDVERNPSQEKLAIYVGGFSALKGSDTLMAAFRDPRLQGVSLKVLGVTEEAAGIVDVPANVQFLGRLPVDQVKQWMAKSWCLVHPTLADTSPNCVKEARVVGLPVVTTPEGGQTQYVKHGKSGWLHQPGDVDGLIAGVNTVTASLETSLSMGQYEHQLCRDALQPDKTMDRFIEIYSAMGMQSH